MIKIGDLVEYKNTSESVIAIGKFGVLHKGHEEILKQVKSTKLHPIIFSFAPSPALFFSKNHAQHGKIFNTKHINDILNKYFQCNYLYFLQKFNTHFSSITPEVFIKLLLERFKMKHLIVGSDFSFGANRIGNIKTLESLALQYNFHLSIVENKNNVSTTLLRNLLQAGEVEKFNNLTAFGEKFKIVGTVVRGMQMAGKVLGRKTANILLKQNQILPMLGVYFVSIKIEDKTHKGIANIGVKPTVGKFAQPLLEVHIMDFDSDIYGKKIEVRLLGFIRKERKFDNLEMLKKQIEIDISSLNQDLEKTVD